MSQLLMNELPGQIPTPRHSKQEPAPRQPMVLHARLITGAGGGPDKTIVNSPRFLTTAGFRSVCAFLRPPNDASFNAVRQRAAAAGAMIEEVDDRGPFDLRVVSRLARLCRRLGASIWHAHDYKTNLLGLLVARTYPMRLVTTVHGWVEYTWRTRLYYQLDRWTLPRYERVICVSPDLVEQCSGLGTPRGRLLLIENAVDTEKFRRTTDVAAAKRRLGWPPQRLLIGAAGRLSPEKAFDTLIRIVGNLVCRGVDLGLVIAGDGKEYDALRRLIAELDLSERVRLLGFQDDLRSTYEALDLFVLSSLREGLPNVVLEAMALAVPVVATQVAGIPRLIADGENGSLVPIGDPIALERAIESALASSELRAQLAAAGRQTIEARYCFAARMEKMVAVYDELLTPSSARRSSA